MSKKPIKIFCDTCSDLTEEVRKERDIESINFTIFFKGKEIDADPWLEVSPTELYDSMRGGERAFTLPATEYEIKTKFKKYMDEYDIVYVAACEKQSQTIVKARRIAEQLMRKNEGVRIEIIDSLNASVGQMLVTLKACDLRDEGKSVEEIIKGTEAIRNNIIQFATVETLTYLSKANKINARSAMFGDLLKIKPILISDADGNQTSIGSVRGRENSINEIIKRFMDNVVEPENQNIYIIHGGDEKNAEKIKAALIEKGLVCKDILLYNVGPVVGITTGPGMVGIFGYGKEVTFRGEN